MIFLASLISYPNLPIRGSNFQFADVEVVVVKSESYLNQWSGLQPEDTTFRKATIRKCVVNVVVGIKGILNLVQEVLVLLEFRPRIILTIQ